MICPWVLNVINPKLYASMAYVDTAYAMWDNLNKRHAIANTPKIHQLKANLASCKQEGLEVVEFYNKLMGMWSELENYVKVPHCTCGKCECEVGERVIKMINDEKTHQFLMGVNDESFSAVRSQVLARDPLPSIDTIFNIIQQEENHKHMMMERDHRAEHGVAFAARVQPASNEKPTCKHCGKYGHDETNCYEVIGYPPS